MPDLLSLLESQKYSDLTLRCEEENFLVHKAILCPQSETFAKACDGNFTESTTATVDVRVIDVETLVRMLVFLYSNQYDVVFEFRSVVYGGDVEALKLQGQQEAVEGREQNEEPKEEPKKEPENSDLHTEIHTANLRLITHAKMYVAADYYQISSLKQYAIEQFEMDIQDFHAQGFGRVVEYVFQSTPDSDMFLRQIVINNAAIHGKALIDEPGFFEYASAAQLFLRQFVESFTEKISEEHTDIEQKLHAANRESNSLGVGVSSLIDLGGKLVKVIECRHCHVKGDGNIEKRGLAYTARCSCGTYFR